MTFTPTEFVDSFCKPGNASWASVTNELGGFTPCFTDVVVLGSAHVAMLVLCALRITILLGTPPERRMLLKYRIPHALAFFSALGCAIIPLLQLSARVSIVDITADGSLPPFEIVSLVLTSVAWFLATYALYLELTYTYTEKGSWYMRFAFVWVAAGQLSKLHFVWLLEPRHSGFFFYLFMTFTVLQCLLGIKALLYDPVLSPKTAELEGAYAALPQAEGDADAYEPLPDEDICPERHVSIISRMLFLWMSPLLSLGYKRPLQNADIWQLDIWDRSTVIFERFDKIWQAERAKVKPSLLWAIARCFGGRFFLGGAFKIGNDASQFVGPLMLNLLLTSMQENEPAWKGYFYAGAIFLGVVLGVLCEAQYFQCVMRVGFRLRSVLVASVFRKSMKLSHVGRQAFSSGRITNMMTSDAESLQSVTQNLNNFWSAPTRIALAMYLLYRELGVASLVAPTVLLLMIPLQALAVSTFQKLAKKALEWTDRRIELISEVLGSMDVIKCYAWEGSFEKKVNEIRLSEMNWLAKGQYFSAVNFFLLTVVPVLVSVLTFGVYAWLGNDLTPAKAFTTMALFNILRFPLFMLPQLIVQVTSASVSVGRLQELLLADERNLDHNPPVSAGEPAISVRGGDFSWSSQGEATLSNISLEVPVGSLVAIVGATGQGKTSLISALLGEMNAVNPGQEEPVIRGDVAYVAQASWIYNATIRDNILFGLPHDPDRYRRAIRVSSLERDLQLLAGGDMTEIGERGVNLSGGQKQRVSIARAIYSEADVYFFDDPLSALDATVAREVFEGCIVQALRGKTRVMATNQLHFLPHVDYVVVVKDGAIAEQGPYADLIARAGVLKELAAQGGDSGEGEAQANGDGAATSSAATADPEAAKAGGKAEETGGKRASPAGTVLIKEEHRETGVVNRSVIMRYVRAMGGLWAVSVMMALYVGVEAVRLCASVWLAKWSGAAAKGSKADHSASYYNRVYAGISFLQVVLTLGIQFFIVSVSQRAARALHKGMLAAVLRAPLLFFQSNPLGRLINRFSKDTTDIDKNLATPCNMFLSAMFQLGSTFCIIGFLAPFALSANIPILLIFYIVYLYFQTTAREVKRLDAVTRSPVYAQFQEALNGLATIRSYRAHERMARANGRAMDANIRFALANMSANRWLGIRLEFLGGLMIFLTASFAILDKGGAVDQEAEAPDVGLVLGYTLSITALMTMTLRLASVAENSFNSVERVGAYVELEPEDPLSVAPQEPPHPPPSWPSTGTIEFQECIMRYRPTLPPVLRGFSASIRSHEKVGIVGRTGAGKSSLFNALFRLVELQQGGIIVDGLNIGNLTLFDLRSRLGIIPQVPVLFTGTIRMNLDPFGEHQDTDIWEALERAHLKLVVSRSPALLDTEVLEGGSNFSVGQRQLLSLARALLRHSSILVLDEATAAVDVGTDALIQKTIRSEFKDCTMLTIAHRLNTIIDSDRILVLDAGKTVEFDTPAALLGNKDGLFTSMVNSTGATNARYLSRIATGDVAVTDVLDEKAEEGKREMSKVPVQRRWSSAAQLALAMNMASRSELAIQEMSMNVENSALLARVRDATLLLRAVLMGDFDNEISQELERMGVEEGRWWNVVTSAMQALASIARETRLHLRASDSSSIGSWADINGGVQE